MLTSAAYISMHFGRMTYKKSKNKHNNFAYFSTGNISIQVNICAFKSKFVTYISTSFDVILCRNCPALHHGFEQASAGAGLSIDHGPSLTCPLVIFKV